MAHRFLPDPPAPALPGDARQTGHARGQAPRQDTPRTHVVFPVAPWHRSRLSLAETENDTTLTAIFNSIKLRYKNLHNSWLTGVSSFGPWAGRTCVRGPRTGLPERRWPAGAAELRPGAAPRDTQKRAAKQNVPRSGSHTTRRAPNLVWRFGARGDAAFPPPTPAPPLRRARARGGAPRERPLRTETSEKA